MRRVAASGVALLLLAFPLPSAAQRAPVTGVDLLQAMHDAYGGAWYSTLTFVQRTVVRRPDGRDTVSIWYESVRYTERYGSQLRIDIGAPSLGNGVLYTADSLWVMKEGRLSNSRAGGNALIPLIESVYLQPVARTAAELAPTGVDLTRSVLTGTWQGRAVWIAGAASASDTTSPQIWIDGERNVIVRALMPPVPGRPLMDARFDAYVPLAGGWLATRCSFYVAGALVQTEEYQDWKAGMPVPASLFDVSQWVTAPHWATAGKTP